MKKAMTSIGIRAMSAVQSTISSLQIKKSLEEVKPDIDKAVTYLQTCEDYSSKQANFSFGSLVEVAGCGFIACDLNKVGTYLIEIGYVALFPKMWSALQEYVVKEKLKSQGCENLIDMLNGYMGVSDISVDFGEELVKVDAISLLFSALKNLDHNDKRAYELINPILGNLQNIIRLNNSHRPYYRKENAVTILERFLDSSNMVLKTDSLLILAYIVEEDDNKHLGDKGVIDFLVDILRAAVNTKSHTAAISSGAYSAMEILDGLNHLAVNDDNKVAIDKAKGIPVIAQMLLKGFTLEEQQLAAEALWNLAFVESIRQNILKKGVGVPALEKLQNSENPDLHQACVSALWQIKLGGLANMPKQPPTYREAVSQEAQSQQQTPRIMISYQWDSQDRVLQIRDKLSAAGYEVWMDVTNMKGDILHAMAQGVENSTAILMCMSEKYKESRSCRSEATYAYKLGKTIVPLLLEPGYQPDGWLGILQGMDLYYEFHSSELLENNMKRLTKAIDDCIGKEKTGEPMATNTKEDQTDAAISSDIKVSSIELAPSSASSTEVTPHSTSSPEMASPSISSTETTPPSASSIETAPPCASPTKTASSNSFSTDTAAPSAARTPSKSTTSEWSADDVQQWLYKINLPELCSILDFCDGDHLEMLYTQFCNNPKEFKDEMKSEFQMSAKVYLQFTVALKKLFKN
ncbi:uncharacterized protein [Amphiura filiformis]|uniref:uncharacterized protein n=1 Tax=Amphiura filiformis TaxID=82378 RepID=UPI003B21CF32